MVTVGFGLAEQVSCSGSRCKSQQRYFTSRSVRAHSLFKRVKCVASFATGNRGTSTHCGDKRLNRLVLKRHELVARVTVKHTGFVVKNARSAELRINNQIHEVANERLGVRNRGANVISPDRLL